jgi:CHAD domain-containing protein
MTQGIGRREAGTQGLRRIFKQQTGRALEALGGSSPPTDRDVHDARKRLKEARATLRLLRKVLGDRVYRRGNVALRDVARPFGEARDARVVADAFDELAGRFPPAHKCTVDAVRAVLAGDRRRIRQTVLADKTGLESARKGVQSVRKRVLRRAIDKRGWPVLGAGLKSVYRAGRTSLRAARRSPSVERLHEWRKQTKYLRHEVEVLQTMKAKLVNDLEKRAHRLTDLLGEDHDLASLRVRLGLRGGGFPRSFTLTLERLIDSRRAELQSEAFALGRRVYGVTPKEFESKLRACWRGWRRGKSAVGAG